MPSAQSYAVCCTLLSAFGIVFLVSIGLLIQSQPEYIKSLNVTSSAPVYEGAAMYAVTLVVSIAVLYLKAGAVPDKYNNVPLSEHIDGVTNEKTPLLTDNEDDEHGL